MTPPRFVSAHLSADGLVTEWADVSSDDDGSALRLSVIAVRGDGSTVQFGAEWTPAAPASPIVSAFDSRTVQQREHEDSASAITRDGDRLRVLFPPHWVDALLESPEHPAEAVVTVNGTDVSSTPFELTTAD